MMIRLLPNWKRVLTRAWSSRLILLAAVLSGIEVALPFLPIVMKPGLFALASLITTVAATGARLLVQKEFYDAGKTDG
jgi:hypothetical protein